MTDCPPAVGSKARADFTGSIDQRGQIEMLTNVLCWPRLEAREKVGGEAAICRVWCGSRALKVCAEKVSSESRTPALQSHFYELLRGSPPSSWGTQRWAMSLWNHQKGSAQTALSKMQISTSGWESNSQHMIPQPLRWLACSGGIPVTSEINREPRKCTECGCKQTLGIFISLRRS